MSIDREMEREEKKKKLQGINRVDCGVSLMSHILARQVGFGFRIRALDWKKREDRLGLAIRLDGRLSDSDR